MANRNKILLQIICFLALAFVLTTQPLFTDHSFAARAYDYGYAVGDQFRYTDSLIETLTTSEYQLVEETHHTYELKIEAIREDTTNYYIRLTVHFANLSQGIENYTSTQLMEGFTHIVAGPRVYFTHTNWEIHHLDWEESIENFQFSTQMTQEAVQEDQDNHFYYWNFTKYVNSELSIYDINSDGQTDGYNIINSYTAHFTDQGALKLRKFFNDIQFENGARYTRLRQINLSLLQTSTVFSLPILIIISCIVVLSIGLGGFIFLRLLKDTRNQREKAA
jgi:hypothetical protein